MKELRAKQKNKLKNQGSGLVLVVVAVAFIGILVGSLLTAVGYAYRLKLYDYNAKDNFYYLEQAMDEVYAGVGNETLSCMQTAYTDVVNQMVEYSESTRNYITRDPKELNAAFKKNFMSNVANSDFMKTAGGALDKFLQSFITNSDVKLVTGNAKIVKYVMGADGKEHVFSGVPGSNVEYSTIVIKNVILSRTANYNRSNANGEFTQTISTDIVVNQPDFEMNFTSLVMDYSTLYDYTMLADCGIEVTQNKSELSISGNVYAAADYYNKGYNDYEGKTSNLVKNGGFAFATDGGTYTAAYNGNVMDKNGASVTINETNFVSSQAVPSVAENTSTHRAYYNFNNGKVSNNVVSYNGSNTLRNDRIFFGSGNQTIANYDGVQENSMYSGLYIKGANVNMQSSELIVPGSISIMDGAKFTLYGKTGTGVGEADVWADNIALAGIGNKDSAPYAMLRANLHVRDDLELNANYSFFRLAGRYYGFGDSTKSDAREYVATVTGDAANAFFYKTMENGTEKLNARGHYNSSAIVVNGQQSKLDLSELDALFVGGRSYVQLSKDYGNVVRKRAVAEEDSDGNLTNETIIDEVDSEGKPVTEKSYVFDGNTDDFKTGESVSLKTNQLAYVPINITGVSTVSVKEVADADGSVYYMVPLPTEVQQSVPFLWILGAGYGTDGKAMTEVPCIRYQTTDGIEYYYDFETIYKLYYRDKGVNSIRFGYIFKSSDTATATAVDSGNISITSAEDVAKQFIIYYYTELANHDASSCRAVLQDIGAKYEGFNFDEGYLSVPNQETNVYSSGAITAKSGTEFSIKAEENLQRSLGYGVSSNETTEYEKMLSTSTINAANVASDMEERYAYIKWSLENYNPNLNRCRAERMYVNQINNHGEQYLTPLNRYLNFNQITATTDIHPAMTGYTGGQSLELASGYNVWISNNDVVISSDRDDGVVQGIVVAKGNVFFDNTVSKFEGLIISGDKIYVDNLVGAALPSRRGRNATGDRIITSISASPEVVRAVLNECMMMTGDTSDNGTYAKKVLSVFKSYENYAYATSEVKTIDVNLKTIDTIQYSDVVRYSNWMKNVVAEPKSESAVTEP